VGSVVCGSKQIIRSVHRARKLLGGGMRQAGILAAAASYALEHNIARLADDHANASRLAAGLEDFGLHVNPAPETNMVMFEVGDVAGFAAALRKSELLIGQITPGRFRAVTHLDISADDISTALGIIEEITRGGIR
jgi:threonine aldolase